MQQVNLVMSHFNVQNNVQQAPNALAAAQDTAQGQELVRESIRAVQTVQANEAAAENQKIHRKTPNDEREGNGNQGRENSRDSFELTKRSENSENEEGKNMPLIRENVKTKKTFDFYV